MNALDYRPKEKVLSDLLPYLAFDEKAATLWLKDGSGVNIFEVIPRNILSNTEEELEVLRATLTGLINQIPEGTILQLMVRREKTSEATDIATRNWIYSHRKGGDEKDSAAQERIELFDAKHKNICALWQDGGLFQTRVFISIRVPVATKVKPNELSGPLSYISRPKKKERKKPVSQIEADLKDTAQALRTGIATAGFETADVSLDQITAIVYEFINPGHPYKKPENEESRTTSLSEKTAYTDFIETRKGLALGRFSVRVGTLKSLPDSSRPALMSAFATMSAPFTLIVTVLVLPQTQERERLQRRQRLATGMASSDGVRNVAAEAVLSDIEQTLTQVIEHGEKLVVASFHVVSFETSDELEPTTHAFEGLLANGEKLGSGCRWFEETVGAYPVFFGILPFAPTFITRPKRLLASNLTDLLPIYGIGAGHQAASMLFETPYQSTMGFSLNEKSPSGNAIVIGSTGSGKSTLACGIILGEAAGNKTDYPSNFVIDVGNSFKRTILYLGGTSLDLSPESGLKINPFDLEHGQTRPDPEKIKFLTALFDEILGDTGNLTKLQRSLLETELLCFYESKAEKTTSGFHDHLSRSSESEMRVLAKLLALWCMPHPYGFLFDGKTNVDLTARHLHFELKGCQRYPDLLRVAMLVVMDLIWRQVKARAPISSRVFVDEAHTLIRPASDGRMNSAARCVDDWFRQMRKFSGAAIALSQTAKDLKSDDIGDGILANAPNRFILRQRGDEKTLREDLKLTDKEIKEVFALTQIRGEYSQFYLHSESIKGVFSYRPTPLELWLSTTHPQDNALLSAEWKEYPEWNLSKVMQHMAERFPSGAPNESTGVAS